MFLLNKADIKRILMSIRNSENENNVNNILGKIDIIPDEKLSLMIKQVGDNEESIKKFFEDKFETQKNNTQDNHILVNEMISYGISDNCIHLHMPVDLHEMISKIGMRKTFDTVKLQMLDAIEKIRQMKNDGFYKFQDKNNIYMISPLLIGHEMQFFNDLDFETNSYKRKDLNNDDFVKENPDAKLAKKIFGTDKNIGTAKISMSIINSKEWQEKRKQKIKEFTNGGITINSDEQYK